MHFYRASIYVRAVLGVVILSVRPSVTRVDCAKNKQCTADEDDRNPPCHTAAPKRVALGKGPSRACLRPALNASESVCQPGSAMTRWEAHSALQTYSWTRVGQRRDVDKEGLKADKKGEWKKQGREEKGRKQCVKGGHRRDLEGMLFMPQFEILDAPLIRTRINVLAIGLRLARQTASPVNRWRPVDVVVDISDDLAMWQAVYVV